MLRKTINANLLLICMYKNCKVLCYASGQPISRWKNKSKIFKHHLLFNNIYRKSQNAIAICSIFLHYYISSYQYKIIPFDTVPVRNANSYNYDSNIVQFVIECSVQHLKTFINLHHAFTSSICPSNQWQ